MDILSRDQLRFLTQYRTRYCVSLFLPTHRALPDARQDPIRLKNLAKDAESRLVRLGLRPVQAKEFLAPVRELGQKTGFWQAQADGAAIFCAQGIFQSFRLPDAVRESVILAERFEVVPLVPLFLEGRRFYLLALSRNHVRFFVGTPNSLMEIHLARVPRSEDEALKYDVRESQMQLHSGARVGGAGRRKAAAVFTGQGIGVDDEQPRTLEFVLQVERGIRRALRDQRAPLVLACVTELLALYRSVNTNPYLAAEAISGNPDYSKPFELHAAAWKVVRPHFEADQGKALARYRELAGSGKCSTDLKEILISSFQARVESLLVPLGIQKLGSFDLETGELELHTDSQPRSEDLFNVAATQTILMKGSVYALAPQEMPGGKEIAAVFRF